MKKYKLLISIILSLSIFILSGEFLILKDGKVINGKIIKLDEDTMTIYSKEGEFIIDRDDIKIIYQNYEEYKKALDNNNEEDKPIIEKVIEEKKDISIEFKYDLDNHKGGMGLGGYGHLVHFFPIDKTISISGIEIYCSKSVNYTKKPILYILNSSYTMIYKEELDNSLFNTKPQWIKIFIDKVVIKKDFYVLFLTNSSKEKSIFVFYTDNKNENHTSCGALNNKNLWKLNNLDKNQTNWKIRVKGNYVD